MKKWNTNDELVGQQILIHCGYDWIEAYLDPQEEKVTVLAVSTTYNYAVADYQPDGWVKVLTAAGDVMVGNQWEEV